jgi:hypothetical protein
MNINLPNQSWPTISKRESVESLVNMYSVGDSSGGKTNQALMPTPGLTEFVNLGGVSVLAALTIHEITYWVYNQAEGTFFASVTPSGTVTQIGGITGTNAASMAAIDNQIIIVTGGTAYIYIISTTTLSALTTINFPDSGSFPVNCTEITALSSFFVALQPASNIFWVSNAADGTTWQALEFGETSTSYGNLIACSNLYDQLFLFGENTTEIWAPTAAQFPFSTQPGNFFNYGCVAPASVTLSRNALFWVHQSASGQAMVVTCTTGNNPIVVSSEALNQELSTYATVADAFGIAYTFRGNEFYQLTFPTAAKTWLFNTTTGLWSEVRSYDIDAFQNPFYTRHRANCFATAGGLLMVGDSVTGKVFLLDGNNYSEDGNTLERVIATATVTNNGHYLTMYEIELFCEVGQGLPSGQGSVPLIMLDVSRDGGFTFAPTKTAPLGPQGSFLTRAKWTQLGIARDWVLRFRFTDPVKFIVLGCVGNIEVEPEDPQLFKVGYRQ